MQNILALLTKDFVKWVVLGLIIAVPVAHFAMIVWLQTFQYKVELKAETYLIAGALALTLVLIAVSWQSIRAAVANPVDSLRSE